MVIQMADVPQQPKLSHVDEHGAARMVDVGDKPTTDRRAVAEGRVRVSPPLAEAIRQNRLAKGNLLEVARLAGVQAAKRTAELIPLCHSLPLSHVDVQATLEEAAVRLRAIVRTRGQTGVEMEALTAVSVAALTVIDMGKSIDKGMVIESVRLVEKTGGTSGDMQLLQRSVPDLPAVVRAVAPANDPDRHVEIRAAVLTVSDRCSRGQAEDTAGPALCEIIEQELGGRVIATACLPDEAEAISRQLTAWADDSHPPDLILTTGGTGLATRDVTPQATARVLERPHPALLELARLRCYAKTPRTFLSRGEAGTIRQTLVVNVPGSRRGACEWLRALVDVLPHAIVTLRDEVAGH